MPIYEYRCPSCGHDFEKLMKISDDPPPCPECGAEVKKKVSASAFVLKGSGWYKDHYGLKKSSGGSESSSSSSDSGSSGGSSDSGSASSGSADSGSSSTSTSSGSTSSD